MTAASAGITLTVNVDDKSIGTDDRLSLYESRAVAIVTDDGATWPSGSYTLALTYHGRGVASASCSWVAGVLSATLNLNNSDLADIFDAYEESVKRISFDLTLWDASGSMVWASSRIDVWRTEYTTATATPTPDVQDFYVNVTAISSGANTVAVDLSGYSLTGAPDIVCSVTGPSGSAAISATASNVTATSFTAVLSGAPESTGYVLVSFIYP